MKVVHRDMKLDNVFYDQNTGFIKVGDLGGAIFLVKQEGNDFHMTPETPMLGTQGHMGPEVYQNKIGPFNDVFAFAALMVHLFTGEAPYDECITADDVRNKVCSFPTPPPNALKLV